MEERGTTGGQMSSEIKRGWQTARVSEKAVHIDISARELVTK